MPNNALDKYNATAIGATAVLTAAAGQSTEAFQGDVHEIRRMQADGLVVITDEHRESQSGARLVTLVVFERLS